MQQYKLLRVVIDERFDVLSFVRMSEIFLKMATLHSKYLKNLNDILRIKHEFTRIAHIVENYYCNVLFKGLPNTNT